MSAGAPVQPAALAAEIKAMLKKDFDFPVAISGRERMGKSTLAIQLAGEINGGLDLNRHVIYTAKELGAKLQAAPEESAIVLDESMFALYKRESMTAERREIVKLMSVVGARRLCLLACVPNFGDLDSYFRNWRVRFWIHVADRGYAVMFRRVADPYVEDPWQVKEQRTAVLRYFRTHGWSDPTNTNWGLALAASPLACKVIHFSALPDAVEQEYRRRKIAALNTTVNTEEPANSRYREAVAKALLYFRGRSPPLPWAELENAFGIPGRTLQYLARKQRLSGDGVVNINDGQPPQGEAAALPIHVDGDDDAPAPPPIPASS